MSGPLPAVPNALNVQLLWTTAGPKTLYTSLKFRYSGGPPNATDATSFASSIFSAMAAESTYWGSDISLTEVIVTDLSSTSGAQGHQSGSTAGGRTPGGLDNGTAVVVDYFINRRYRGGKPRSYLPFGVGSDLTSRVQWDGAFVTAVEGALSTFFSAVIGLSHGTTTITDHISISYFSGFTVVSSPTTGRSRNVPTRRTTPLVDTITGFTVSSRPGSQRRRN